MPSNPSFFDYCPSFLGFWTIRAHNEALISLSFSSTKPSEKVKKNSLTDLAKKQLEAYFTQKSPIFDLPLDWSSYSSFYKQVWTALQAIPFGQTASYSHIAQNILNPKAVRAVGLANGKNPFAIIIPCHRIIGKNKALTGYAHGIDVKRGLLEHEGAIQKVMTLF